MSKERAAWNVSLGVIPSPNGPAFGLRCPPLPDGSDDTALELGRSVAVRHFLNALSERLQHYRAPQHQLPGGR